jgi:excisionase family DNA binding protein
MSDSLCHLQKLATKMRTVGADAKTLAVSPARGAEILGVGRTKFYELLNKQIPALKLGRRTLVRVADIEKFLNSLSAGGEHR